MGNTRLYKSVYPLERLSEIQELLLLRGVTVFVTIADGQVISRWHNT